MVIDFDFKLMENVFDWRITGVWFVKLLIYSTLLLPPSVDPKNWVTNLPLNVRLKLRCEDPSRSDERSTLNDLFERYVDKCITSVLDGMFGNDVVGACEHVIPIAIRQLCQELCSSLEAFLSLELVLTSKRMDMEGIFIFCIAWLIGAALVDASRNRFWWIFEILIIMSMNYFMIRHRWQSWSSQVSMLRRTFSVLYFSSI